MLEHGGKSYEFNPMSKAQVAAIEKDLYRKDRARIRGYFDDGEFDEAELQRLLSELRDKDEQGHYDLMGPAMQRAVLKTAGRLVLLTHVLGLPRDQGGEDEAHELLRARSVEVMDMLTLVYNETFPDAKKEALAREKAQDEADAKNQVAPR